jgi:hypothetical protein
MSFSSTEMGWPTLVVRREEDDSRVIFFSLISNTGKDYRCNNDWKMEIVGNIVFGFLMPSLDTLNLKDFLPYIPISNWSIGYMVGNFIQILFQWYMEFPLTPYE